jgi:nicotinamide-nucleotide amidase
VIYTKWIRFFGKTGAFIMLLNSELATLNPWALVADLMLRNKWLLATAESCTGGLIAAACTDMAGSSAWFDRGFVTYSNAAKIDMLGVDPALIDALGAVSEAVALAMAGGALRHSQAQVSLAVTGVAGPSGGSAEKPVGTVCFAWATPTALISETRHFAGNRAAVRTATVAHALGRLVEIAENRA